MMTWADAVGAARRVLLIVNASADEWGELSQVLDALQRHLDADRICAIAPLAAVGHLVARGIRARSILPFELESGFFLQSDRALQWAIREHADIVVGSEPYAPDNVEVKAQFELRVAPMLGAARLVAHSLPLDRVVVLSAEALWRRAARPETVSEHRARVGAALEQLHQLWQSEPATAIAQRQAVAANTLAIQTDIDSIERTSVIDACRWSYDRLHAALQSDGGYPPSPIRCIVDPANVAPAGGFSGRIDTIRRPAQLATGVRHHGLTLSFRGTAGEPYSYLLMSRPIDLQRGDAALAEGRLHHGGVTIGLVKAERWASRVDVIDRGRFLAAAVATERGPHAIVVAHCLHGADRRSAIALRRIGIRRAEHS
ncbi:MAG: hypothetical protein ABI024_07675 [Vicinamibacterales bacterium]